MGKLDCKSTMYNISQNEFYLRTIVLTLKQIPRRNIKLYLRTKYQT